MKQSPRSPRHWSDALVKLHACQEAVAWARTQPSLAAAWRNCECGDWMLWLLGRLVGSPTTASRRRLVLIACACAREALRYVPTGEHRPMRAIETAERWARRERGVTLDDVRLAASAAADAAYAAADAAAADNRASALKRCADIVRQHQPRPPRLVVARKRVAR